MDFHPDLDKCEHKSMIWAAEFISILIKWMVLVAWRSGATEKKLRKTPVGALPFIATFVFHVVTGK